VSVFIYIVVFLFSVIIHEVAHGYVAHLRGDDTAKIFGRITLNPLSHIELFGSVILPVLLLIIKAPIFFGWARPIPINVKNLKNPKVDIPIVSFAGPAANVLLAILSGLGVRLIATMPDFEDGFGGSVESCLYIMLTVNIVLAFINLIPIPPLDGSKAITYFMPRDIAKKYLNLSPFVCLAVLFILLSSGTVWRFMYTAINLFVANLSGIAF
jgi:Zn-dependent protease